jgi:hypothetical protein
MVRRLLFIRDFQNEHTITGWIYRWILT